MGAAELQIGGAYRRARLREAMLRRRADFFRRLFRLHDVRPRFDDRPIRLRQSQRRRLEKVAQRVLRALQINIRLRQRLLKAGYRLRV